MKRSLGSATIKDRSLPPNNKTCIHNAWTHRKTASTTTSSSPTSEVTTMQERIKLIINHSYKTIRYEKRLCDLPQQTHIKSSNIKIPALERSVEKIFTLCSDVVLNIPNSSACIRSSQVKQINQVRTTVMKR